MPCGTGKSRTAYWIAEALKAKTILVAVPSLALVRQSLADWTREFLAHNVLPDCLCVCSDESVGNPERDEFVGESTISACRRTRTRMKLRRCFGHVPMVPKLYFRHIKAATSLLRRHERHASNSMLPSSMKRTRR